MDDQTRAADAGGRSGHDAGQDAGHGAGADAAQDPAQDPERAPERAPHPDFRPGVHPEDGVRLQLGPLDWLGVAGAFALGLAHPALTPIGLAILLGSWSRRLRGKGIGLVMGLAAVKLLVAAGALALLHELVG